MEETRFDPRRRLCPDGACIGVIGSDGRCKVCGRPASGVVAAVGNNVPAPAEDEGDGHADADVHAEEAPDAGAESAAPGEGEGEGFDSKRRLCDDGSCVGVVGPDGVCRICGRRVEG